MDMMEMLGKLREMQSKMQEVQEGLVHITAEADAGGGMVKAVVNGKRQVIKLDIDPVLCKVEDREMMQDLVVAAVNKALEEVEAKSQQELQQKAQGMMPNIPGMNFGI